MENNKKCNKCNKYLEHDKFDEGYKSCQKCMIVRKRNQEKHKDRNNEKQRTRYEEDEEYRNNKQEMNKKWASQIVVCDVCNCSLSQKRMSSHQKTNKHQRNLERNNPRTDNEEIQS